MNKLDAIAPGDIKMVELEDEDVFECNRCKEAFEGVKYKDDDNKKKVVVIVDGNLSNDEKKSFMAGNTKTSFIDETEINQSSYFGEKAAGNQFIVIQLGNGNCVSDNTPCSGCCETITSMWNWCFAKCCCFSKCCGCCSCSCCECGCFDPSAGNVHQFLEVASKLMDNYIVVFYDKLHRINEEQMRTYKSDYYTVSIPPHEAVCCEKKLRYMIMGKYVYKPKSRCEKCLSLCAGKDRFNTKN